MNFLPERPRIRTKPQRIRALPDVLFFLISFLLKKAIRNIFLLQSSSFVGFLGIFILYILYILFDSNALLAVTVELDGTDALESGTDCGLATYRFGTNTTYNSQALDLLVEVVEEDNDKISNCVFYSGETITVDIRDRDVSDDVAYMDLKITIVEKGTNIPVEVDRLAISGFDLDSTSGTSTDDLYFTQPDGSYVSSSSNVNVIPGSYFGDKYQIRLQGQTTGNCTDGSGLLSDIACRGGIIFINGPNGPNTVSSVNLRVQNDNAYGTSTSSTALRRFQLSLELSYIEELITANEDYGDAASSYGSAGTSVSTNLSLGYGTFPDHEDSHQFSADADSDDTDTDSSDFDDEEGISLNGQPLDNQTLQAGTTTNLDVITFGTGFLSAWLDLNADGDFDTNEQVVDDFAINSSSVTNSSIPIDIPASAIAGDTAIRFRFSQDKDVGSTGFSSSGEVEDYKVAILNPPNLELVKRITAINPGQSNEVQFNTFVDDGTAGNEDNDPNWPTNEDTYLPGAISVDNIQPGDEVEYTIYFLSNGGQAANNVQICDVIPDNMTLVESGYGFNAGMSISFDGVTTALSNEFDNDQGEFYQPNTDPPTFCQKVDSTTGNLVTVNSGNNLSGAIVVKLDTSLPFATGTGIPTNSYGLIRFRAKVK